MTNYEHTDTVQLKHLAAASLFCAKNDIRTSLNGVAITSHHVAATTGGYLAQIEISDVSDTRPTVIIPGNVIAAIVKKAKTTRSVAGQVCWNEKNANAAVFAGPHTELFHRLDGTFPDVARVIPKHTTLGEMADFSWAQMVLFEKAAELLGTKKGELKKATLSPDGQNPALVLLPGHDEFIGVICPLRGLAK